MNKPAPSTDSFLPALLDRLSLSGNGQMNRSIFRKTVWRDLSWLLNCSNLSGQLPLESYPNVKNSVINFGIPPLAGGRFVQSDLELVAQEIRHAVVCFEPRIFEKSLNVSVVHEADAISHNCAQFLIEATCWFEPYPIDMVLRARWDMETGGVDLREN